MEKQEKKTISFGFSKLQKAPVIGSKLPPKSDDVVQFIDCLENKSIKVKNEEPKKSVLVIPLNRPDSHSIVQSRIVRRQLKATDTAATNDASVSENSRDDLSSKAQTSTSKDNPTTVENAPENLDQLAAKEILEDLKKSEEKKEEKSTFSVPLASAPVSEKESTLDDYDNIPIADFGMAMLRGMGWKPGKGIGKNEQLVTAKPPVLRPKGLGLGADKVIQPEKTSETKEETLKLVKGSYIRIIAGSHKDLFGEIMGFDEETGRLIAKMAISGSVLTFNEFMVKAVSKDEYNKNSKVLNVKKYEEFKEKENAGEDPNDIIESMKNKGSKSVSSSRYNSDRTQKGKSDERDYSRYDRRDRYKESRNRNDRRRSNSHSEDETTSRKSQVKDRRYERRRYSSESDVDSDSKRQKYSKSDRSNIEIKKQNWKSRGSISHSPSEASEHEKQKQRRGKCSSSVSDEDSERSKKKKHKNTHHSSEGKRKKKFREASSEEEEEEDNFQRRRKNDRELVKKSSKSSKSCREDSSYSKDKNKSKKRSRKYSISNSSSSSEEENIRSSKKIKKRHKKKHYRSRSRS